MAKIYIDRPSYRVGDEIIINLDLSQDLERARDSKNININILRVRKERNHTAMGFGHNFAPSDEEVSVVRKIPPSFLEGLYLVSGFRFVYEDGRKPESITPDDPNSLFFWVSSAASKLLSWDEVSEKIQQIDSDRGAYNSAPHTTELARSSQNSERFVVLVFGVGCLLHATQHLEGYRIHPLGTGFSYSHMLEGVNAYTKSTIGVEFGEVESIQNSFSQATPLFVVHFSTVIANDYKDAGDYCASYADNIFTILAYERGQRPASFASVILDQDTKECWHALHFPGYTGNLISDFSSSAAAESLEKLLPKIDSSPWLDLLMRIYADAISESNPFYACLKHWSVLEMVSKRRIADNSIEIQFPNGQHILDFGGNPRRTNSALGKAYKYCIDIDIPPSVVGLHQNEGKIIFETYEDATRNPNYNVNTRIISLWDRLTALYEVRNSTAHAGKFDLTKAKNGSDREKLAADLWGLEFGMFTREVEGMMRTVIAHELKDA